jgi:hypothetical protein
VFAPDSPQFLFESERFEELEKAFTMISKFNCAYKKDKVDSIMIKLKAQAKIDNAKKAAETNVAAESVAENKTK